MRRIFLLALTLAAPAAAQTPEEIVASGHVWVRARLDPAEPVLVGQPVRLWVDVATRTWFLRAPAYPAALEVSGAVVVPPEAFGVNSTERVGGETYAVQSRSYTIFPQTAGRLEVPPVEVRLVVALDGASPSPEIPLATEPAGIEARLPPGAEGLGTVLATLRLTVREEYSRRPDGLRVGDSLRRTVTRTLDGAVAMLLPPLAFTAGEGVAVYPDRPEVSDRRGRGRMTGTRVESVTYVLEEEGTFELPEIEIAWWELGAGRLRREVLPAVELAVAANPDLAPEHLGEAQTEEAAEAGEETPVAAGGVLRKRLLTAAAVLLLLAPLLRRLPRLVAGIAERRRERAASEAAAFRRFRRAARGGDPGPTLAAFLGWLDRGGAAGGEATVESFAARSGDRELEIQGHALLALLYARPGAAERKLAEAAWSGRRFARLAARARSRRATRAAAGPSPTGRLPRLNPGR